MGRTGGNARRPLPAAVMNAPGRCEPFHSGAGNWCGWSFSLDTDACDEDVLHIQILVYAERATLPAVA